MDITEMMKILNHRKLRNFRLTGKKTDWPKLIIAIINLATLYKKKSINSVNLSNLMLVTIKNIT